MTSPQTILITGSTRGIGLGMAAEFLKRGHNVVISGRSQASVDKAVADLTKTFEPRHIFGYPCDVTSLEQVETLWQASAARFGRIDIWINNAGLAHTQTPIWELAPSTVEAVIRTNMLGTYY